MNTEINTERHIKELSKICTQRGIDPEALTLKQTVELSNEMVRKAVYEKDPAFNPQALEALLLFSENLSKELGELSGLGWDTPISQAVTNSQNKEFCELVTQFNRKILNQTLKQISGR